MFDEDAGRTGRGGMLLRGDLRRQAGRGAASTTDRHVRELARYLDGVKIVEPVAYRQLAVYPILVEDVPLLRGQWLTLDAAIARGILVVSEKEGGSVPVVRFENLSRNEYIFIMTGIRTREDGLLGDGVGLDGTLVHYGVQIGEQAAPQPGPRPRPSIIYPKARQQ